MDVVKAVETYITKMVSTPNAMKVLLLDTHTVRTDLRVKLMPNDRLSCPSDTNSVVSHYPIHSALSSSIPHRPNALRRLETFREELLILHHDAMQCFRVVNHNHTSLHNELRVNNRRAVVDEDPLRATI